MKAISLRLWLSTAILMALTSFIFISCDKDEIDPPTGENRPVTLNFGENFNIAENATEKEVRILFSKAATKDGTLELEVITDIGTAFQTTPSVKDDFIEISVEKGDAYASFIFTPINNTIADEPRIVQIELSAVSEGFALGTKKSLTITILDDELVSKPKSIETTGGGWRSEKTYEYDGSGRIKKIHWETETPGLRSGTDTYYYATNGLVERINQEPNIDEFYFQENGKIVRSEVIKNDIKTAYSEYEFDAYGHVAAKKVYNRQSSGAFLLSFVYVYLYHTDGNLFVQQTYIPQSEPDDLLLISTRTYDGYTDAYNPFPVELLPGMPAQQTLPIIYRLKENGSTLQYQFSYAFRDDGLPSQRNTSGAATEITVFQYY